AQVPTMRREGAVAASVASEAAASVALAAAWGNPFNSFDQVRIGHSPNGGYGISTADRPQSALMLRARMTLPPFSLSSAMRLPKSGGGPTSGAARSWGSRALILGSARPALMALLSLSIICDGVFFGAPTPNHWLAS